jgi:hypothetical protein
MGNIRLPFIDSDLLYEVSFKAAMNLRGPEIFNFACRRCTYFSKSICVHLRANYIQFISNILLINQ